VIRFHKIRPNLHLFIKENVTFRLFEL